VTGDASGAAVERPPAAIATSRTVATGYGVARPPAEPDGIGLCIPEQRQPLRIGTVTVMKREHMKTAVIGAWVLACSVMGMLLKVSSASDWVLLIGSAVVPPLVLLQMWRPPAQTTSESIREVLK
jgi:hypothetical protein